MTLVLTGADLTRGYVFPAQAGQERRDMESGAGRKENAGAETGVKCQRRRKRACQRRPGSVPGNRNATGYFPRAPELGKRGSERVEQAEIKRLSKLFELKYRIQGAKTAESVERS